MVLAVSRDRDWPPSPIEWDGHARYEKQGIPYLATTSNCFTERLTTWQWPSSSHKSPEQSRWCSHSHPGNNFWDTGPRTEDPTLGTASQSQKVVAMATGVLRNDQTTITIICQFQVSNWDIAVLIGIVFAMGDACRHTKPRGGRQYSFLGSLVGSCICVQASAIANRQCT